MGHATCVTGLAGAVACALSAAGSLPSLTCTSLRKYLPTCLAILTLCNSAQQAFAGLLLPNSAVFTKQMAVNPALMLQDPANGVVGTPSNNLTLSINSALDEITIAGQVTYTWTLSSAATNVAELAVWDDYMVAMADIDPAFSTTSLSLNLLNVGYIVSQSADWEMELWFPASVRIPNHGGNTQDLRVDWPITFGTAGVQSNFSASTSSAAPFAFTAGVGEKLHLDTLGDGMWLKLRPPNGATFFPPSSTVSIVVDFPISGSGVVVPEPASIGLLAASLALLTRSRRRDQ